MCSTGVIIGRALLRNTDDVDTDGVITVASVKVYRVE